MTIALDRNALTVAGSIDSDFLSFGYLASSILELFTEVPCTVLIDITSTTDIEISLVPENPSQIQWCVALTEVSLLMIPCYNYFDVWFSESGLNSKVCSVPTFSVTFSSKILKTEIYINHFDWIKPKITWLLCWNYLSLCRKLPGLWTERMEGVVGGRQLRNSHKCLTTP